MKIITVKKKSKSKDKNNVITHTTSFTDHGVFTKDQAADFIADSVDLMYELIEFIIDKDLLKNDIKMEKLKRVRNRMGILKNCKIIIK